MVCRIPEPSTRTVMDEVGGFFLDWFLLTFLGSYMILYSCSTIVNHGESALYRSLFVEYAYTWQFCWDGENVTLLNGCW